MPEAVLTISEGFEGQSARPRSAALDRVRPQLEDVVGSDVQSIDDDHRVGGVDSELVEGSVSSMVDDLVEHDLAVP